MCGTNGRWHEYRVGSVADSGTYPTQNVTSLNIEKGTGPRQPAPERHLGASPAPQIVYVDHGEPAASAALIERLAANAGMVAVSDGKPASGCSSGAEPAGAFDPGGAGPRGAR